MVGVGWGGVQFKVSHLLTDAAIPGSPSAGTAKGNKDCNVIRTDGFVFLSNMIFIIIPPPPNCILHFHLYLIIMMDLAPGVMDGRETPRLRQPACLRR